MASSKLSDIGTFGDNQDLWAKLPIDDLRLLFVGTVTRIPRKGALPICTVFDTQFFLMPPAESMTHEGACPAWSVPIMTTSTAGKRKKPDATPGPHPQPPLIVLRRKDAMEFKYSDLAQQKTVTPQITFYSLERNPDWTPPLGSRRLSQGKQAPSALKSAAAHVQLFRPEIREQIKTVVKKVPKPKKIVDEFAKCCGHLLR